MQDTDAFAVFDFKWTAEALANIVDNAIKYTEPVSYTHLDVYKRQTHTRVTDGEIETVGNGITQIIVVDRKSTRLNSSHVKRSRMPSSA